MPFFFQEKANKGILVTFPTLAMVYHTLDATEEPLSASETLSADSSVQEHVFVTMRRKFEEPFKLSRTFKFPEVHDGKALYTWKMAL